MPRLLILLALSTLLAGCAGPAHWTVRHPAFPAGTKASEVAIPDLGDRWILVRGNWFSDRLHIDPSQVYDTVGTIIREEFSRGILAGIPTSRTAPADIITDFAQPETQRLDERIFIKGRFPFQGQTVMVDGFAVPQLFLVHELTVGPDLSRETIYDYEKANQDTDGKTHKVKNIVALATWTLWDNRKQRPLTSGITEVSRPWNGEDGSALRDLVHGLVTDLAARTACDLEGGCP